MKWQPIETAPKDEDEYWPYKRTRVLLTDGDTVSVGRWDYRGTWTNEAEIEWLGDDGAVHETWTPTHWMQLPEPPK